MNRNNFQGKRKEQVEFTHNIVMMSGIIAAIIVLVIALFG